MGGERGGEDACWAAAEDVCEGGRAFGSGI